jgi:hypothetical protein
MSTTGRKKLRREMAPAYREKMNAKRRELDERLKKDPVKWAERMRKHSAARAARQIKARPHLAELREKRSRAKMVKTERERRRIRMEPAAFNRWEQREKQRRKRALQRIYADPERRKWYQERRR